MKIIKTFNLFESNDQVSEIISVLRDILSELDFTDIEWTVNALSNKFIKIEILRFKKPFTPSDIESVLDSICGYMEEFDIYPIYTDFKKKLDGKEFDVVGSDKPIITNIGEHASYCEIQFDISSLK